MDWTMLMVLAGLWLASPIVLLIALVVSRHQLAEARRQAAAWERLARSQEAPAWQTPVAPTPAVPAQREQESESWVAPPPALTLAPRAEDGWSDRVVTASRSAPIAAADADSSPDHDWRPAEPGPLERVLRAASGWPKLIAPFLAQNIGWFVGGFCFVAGALFLVANTSGFLNALVVWGSLIGATVFLIWAGYQFRRQRPELVAASSVLLILGLMLGPLDLAVAVRLFAASGDDRLLLSISVVLAVLTLAGFAGIAWLVSALIDRALTGRYVVLLTALAGLQLAAPVATIFPNWPALAVWHGLLLILLGVSLRRFTGEWLRQIFVDRRSASVFAAGMLVYAATVSFVHLAWIWPESLPIGYAGPFLMALCLLLFPVDAALREWVHRYAFLSRFSFALYGLSVVAIAVAAPSTPAALLTLTLGAGLYGWMTWRYLTWLPLYLLLGCVAGLYGYAVLQWQPPAGHLLASVPGLLALLALGYLMNARSPMIARQCWLICGSLLIGLTGWSLFWSTPGMLSFATATAAALLGYGALRAMQTLPDADDRWTVWSEIWLMTLAAVAVAYAPNWTPFDWAMQTAFGWLALAALWSGLSLQGQRQSSNRPGAWVNGAVLMIGAALTLAVTNQWPPAFGAWPWLGLLTCVGALLLWLSLGLRRQSLFYGALAVAAALGISIKHGYFPGPGSGVAEFILVVALWILLWRLQGWMERREALLAELNETAAPSLAELIRAPLQQAMGLLWAVGFVHLSVRLLDGNPSPVWPWSAALGTISSVLLIGSFHQYRWMALPMLLGLAGVLVELADWGYSLPWLGTAAGLYALLLWRFGVAVLHQPITGPVARALRFASGAGARQQVENSLHGCALLIAAGPLVLSPALAVLGEPAAALWPMLGVSGAVFILTGWRYRTEIHGWLTLMALTLGVGLAGFASGTLEYLLFGQPVSSAGLSLSMALVAAGLESERAAALAWLCRPLWMVSAVLYGLALAGAWWMVNPWPPAAALAGLALYLLLLLRRIPRPGMVGLALAALIASSLSGLVDHLGLPLRWLPLILALWQSVLLAVWRYYGPHSPDLWQPALERGLTWLPTVTVVLLFLMPDMPGAMCSVTLLTLAATAFCFGEWQDEAFWRKVGLWLALAGVYALWQWNAPLTWAALIALAPWYALQSGLLLLALSLIEQRLTGWLDAHDLQAEAERARRWLTLEQAMSETTPWLLLATLLFLALHIGVLLAALIGWSDAPLWRFGKTVDALAAGVTLTLLAGWSALHAWRKPQEPQRIYPPVFLLAALVSYLRLLVWGLTPFTPWDTTGLLAAAILAFLLHQFTGARPWYRLGLWLPLLALATAPWQLVSPWLGGTLLTAGVVYLSLAGAMRNPLPLYLGVLALNGAIYLWAPLWAGRAGLWQFYLIPGAVSALALLHLHRRELRPSVLSGGRLAALSVLYAGAALDVFLRAELWVFALALGLALAGIVLGIALRIRAFLYAGVAFLIVNVGGQLLRFYPEQGISRALILLGLGATITGGMVLFNLKREAILQRVRIMRADLAAWE